MDRKLHLTRGIQRRSNWTISLFMTEIDHFDLSRASLKEAGSLIMPLE
jgi:predicted translin family RNA/ssDNA-binding protein